MLGDRLAKGPTFLGIRQRGVQAGLRETHRQRRDRDPSAGERVQELPVPATPLTQQVLGRNLAVLEAQRMRVRGVPAELPVRLQHVVTRRSRRHYEGGYLGMPIVGLPGDRGDRHPGRDVRPAVGDELLGAVDHPFAIALLGAGLRRSGVRAGLRLGEAERPELAPADEVGQPARLLLGSAEVVDRRRAEANRRLERDPDPGIAPRDLLDGDAQRQEIGAGATCLFGERQAEQAELAHLADDVVAELVVAVELHSRRHDHLAREVPARVADRLLLRGQFKIHVTQCLHERRPLLGVDARRGGSVASSTSAAGTSSSPAIQGTDTRTASIRRWRSFESTTCWRSPIVRPWSVLGSVSG